MRKYKMKKAVNGLQDIAVPEQGSASNVLSSTASIASVGSQFGPLGAGVGAIAGLGLGLLQKGKQDRANKAALATNADRKMNRQYAGDEDTINQGMQRFKKGGRVSTKVIEIEGKKTPEIHTDSKFNVKNLGTTPHSKGGDKVVAEEGDIVFNTQNSLTKYNKIATAIAKGDKATLKEEKNKLPEDSGTKNQTGNKGVKKRDYMMEEEEREAAGLPKPSYMVRPTPTASSKRPFGAARTTSVTGYELPNSADQRRNLSQPKITGNLGIRPQEGAFNVPARTRNYVAKDPAFEGYKLPNTKSTIAKKPIVKKSAAKKSYGNPIDTLSPIKTTSDPDLSPLVGVQRLDQKLNSGNMKMNKAATSSVDSIDATSTPSSKTTNTTSPSKFGATDALQFAGVANNLFQGLKVEKAIDESYYNPDKIKYTDRSDSLRKQSNQAASAQVSNARALSGGLAGNLRANASSARVANLDRQGNIDEREQGRADAITNANTEISNQAKQVNLGRKDAYQNQMMAQRAAKQSYIDQAASDIGQYGMVRREEGYLRSRDKLASDAQLAGFNSINGRYQHKSNLDGSTYFDNDADSSITRFGTSGGNRKSKNKTSVFKKGTKSVNVKYKSVV